MRAEYETLYEEIKAAKTYSREIDKKLAVLFDGWKTKSVGTFGGHYDYWYNDEYGISRTQENFEDYPPNYTSNLTKLLFMIERRLPAIPISGPFFSQTLGKPGNESFGWKINLYRGMTPSEHKYGMWEATIRPHAQDYKSHVGRTAELALAAAFVYARIQMLPVERQ